MGYNVREFDLDYDHPVDGMDSSFSGRQKRSCFDMNGEAGYVFLDNQVFQQFFDPF